MNLSIVNSLKSEQNQKTTVYSCVRPLRHSRLFSHWVFEKIFWSGFKKCVSVTWQCGQIISWEKELKFFNLAPSALTIGFEQLLHVKRLSQQGKAAMISNL